MTKLLRIVGRAIKQRFLEHFASALILNHPPNQRCKNYTDEEISAVFEKFPKEEFFNFFTEQIPIEVQPDSPGNQVQIFSKSMMRTHQ